MSDENTNFENEYEQWLEVAGLTDYITQYGSGSSVVGLRLTDLYKYLQNPYDNIDQIRKSSEYLTNKYGVIKESLRTLKSILTLNHHLSWSNYDDIKKIRKYEDKIYKFLDDIDVKKVVRDGIYEAAKTGTVVTCLRKNKYVQFLELENLRIVKQRNGKWVVEIDLKSIDKYRTVQDKLAIIESLPDEVTVAKYNLYKNKGEDYRYVELKNCDVISPDAPRNYPYSLPYTIGAWNALLQKELIDRVERSVSDRMIKQILLLHAFPMDGKNGTKMPPKPVIRQYFNEISKLLQKKNQRSHNSDESSVGLVGLPSFFELKEIEVNTDLFKKELYEKINRDIFMNLGISETLISGGGSDSNFSSAQLNNEKLFRYLFTILEQFETIINNYIKNLLPNNLSCRFYFDRVTMLDRDKYIEQCKAFYQQTGIFSPWAESLLGVPLQFVLGQARYEKEVLKIDQYINPPENFFNQSGDKKGGRSEETNPTNENTIKSKTNGNNNPKPSI
ncbi:hypothetical protein [Bacillus smithii]|uniref:hypothetical protein n=1 Tax=Bacillus smithii TaxID=1479 RepID=UPI003D221081